MADNANNQPAVKASSGMKMPKMPMMPWANKPAKFYMMEFVLMHIFTWALLGVLTFIISLTVTSLFEETSALTQLGVTGAGSLMTGLIILLPLVSLTVNRTRAKEALVPQILDRRLRHLFLYIFMIGYVGSIIWALWLQVGLIVNNLLTLGAGSEWGKSFWMQIIIAEIAILVAGSALLYFWQEGKASKITKMYIPMLALTSLVAAILLVAFPVREGRGAFIDGKIETDIQSIQNEVSNYYNDNTSIPTLDQLDLDSDIKNRAKKYNYEVKSTGPTSYEVCADFKTDSKDRDDFYYGTSNSHSKGRDCVEGMVYSDDYYDDYYNQPDFNLEEGPSNNLDGGSPSNPFY